MEINLKAFMKPELKEQEVIELPGIEAFKDDKGEPIPFRLKRLSRSELKEIRENNTTKTIVKDKRTNKPMVGSNNRIVYDEQYDSEAAGLEIMVECFVQPNLKAKELRDFYGVELNTELPEKMFQGDDWEYANKCVLIACGLADEEMQDEVMKKIKN